MKKIFTFLATILYAFSYAQESIPEEEFNTIEEKVIEWRRDFHENPELSNREFGYVCFLFVFQAYRLGTRAPRFFLRFRAGVQLPKAGKGLGEMFVKLFILFCFFIRTISSDICAVLAQILFPE